MKLHGRRTTFSGDLFDVVDAEPDDFRIEDIVHHLSMTPCFDGAAIGFFSMAQHAVYLSFGVPAGKALAALLRQGARAFMGTLPNTVRALFPEYVGLETVLEAKLALGFGLPVTAFYDDELEQIDHHLQAMEATIMLRSPQHIYDAVGGRPDTSLYTLDKDFRFWPWQEAETRFLERLRYLRQEH
jgi:hypothetical protein